MAAADARFFGDKFLAMEGTLEAETSVSNLTQYKLFIADDKKIRFLEWPSRLRMLGKKQNVIVKQQQNDFGKKHRKFYWCLAA